MGFISDIDKQVLMFMSTDCRNGFFDIIMPYITLLGELGIVCIFCCLLLLIFKKTRKAGIECAITMTVNFAVCNGVIKRIFCRERPPLSFWHPDLMITAIDNSFPSGHTAIWFAFSTALFFHNKKLGALSFAVSVLVGFSRVYLCVHWLSDVVGGMLVGILCAILVHILLHFFAPKIKLLYYKKKMVK